MNRSASIQEVTEKPKIVGMICISPANESKFLCVQKVILYIIYLRVDRLE